ncbi:PspC domain-containing protein [Pseudopedobacter beijingensis]|uniref:PspC domain-containing protein n=1 Tax=Pseudopedobacter beijingensis TaxID=1207056 RepID=A0ABW4IG34_9SPHI
MTKKLIRNTRNKVVAGVSSGLADYFQLDVIWVRIAFVLATLAGGTGLWIYIILWIAIPEKRTPVFSFKDDEPFAFDEKTNFDDWGTRKNTEAGFKGSFIGGTILIALGSYFLLYEFDLIPYWFSLSKLWPLFIIGIGLFVIYNSVKKENNGKDDKEEEANQNEKPEEELKNDDKEDTTNQ